MSRLQKSLLILAFGLLYIGSAVATNAAPVVVVYTDRSVYNLAATSTATINFEGIAAPNSFANFSNATGLSVGGVTFVGTQTTGHHLLVVDSGLSAQYNYGTGAVLEGPSSTSGLGGVLTVTLPGGVTAFGTDVMSKATATDFSAATFLPDMIVTITFVDLSTQTFLVPTFPRDPILGPAFFGITSDTAILSVAFSAPSLPTGLGNSPMLDNVTYGAAVPEPATLLLLGTGLVGTVATLRKRLSQPQINADDTDQNRILE